MMLGFPSYETREMHVAAIQVVQFDELPGVGRLGRHVEHDSRSRSYGVEALPGQLVEQAVLWRRWSPILDQGNIGSCTTNAMAGWLGCEPHTDNATYAAHFDEQFALWLYERCTRLDRIPGHWPPDDTGSSGLAAAA